MRVKKCCRYCKHYEEEGGDYVPYGSSGAYLPIQENCLSEKAWKHYTENVSKVDEPDEELFCEWVFDGADTCEFMEVVDGQYNA